MSDSLWPHGLSPTSLLCPWDSPGKDTGVGCHALLQGIYPTQGLNSHVCCVGRRFLYHWCHLGSPTISLWECKLVQPLWKTVWKFLEKLKIELPYDPAISLLGIHLEKNIIQKDICTPMFIAVLFTIAKTWKQPNCPSRDEWIKKMWCI